MALTDNLRRLEVNIAQGLAHAKKAFGSHQAVACGNTRYTWNDFEQRTDALARGLAALGIVRGDRVAVLMLNCHRYLELYYACARMGAVIVPLNIRLARTEIVFILNDSETKVLVVDKPFAPYATGRDTFPSVEHIVYCGEETPPDMINYDDVMSKGKQIAGYKVPRSIEFYPEALPKSGAGKILKRDLRTKYWADKGRNVN